MFGLLANTINADLGMLPGLGIIGPGLGFPVSVLAAFLERPFYSRAGVDQQTIWYSLQANCVSHLVGFVCLLAFLCLGVLVGTNEAAILVWPFLAVGVSTIIEGRVPTEKSVRKTVPLAVGDWRKLGECRRVSRCAFRHRLDSR